MPGRERNVIEVNDIIKVVAEMLMDGVFQILNTYWVEVIDTNSLSQSDLLDDLCEWVETIYDEIDALMPNNVSFLDIAPYNFTKDEVIVAQDWPTLTAGGSAANSLAPGVAVFCWMPTSQAHCQGRKWFGPFTVTGQDDGTWMAAIMTAVTAGVANMLGSKEMTNGSVWRALVPHFIETIDEVVTELDPPEFFPITSILLTNNPGYQRRRRVGSGG